MTTEETWAAFITEWQRRIDVDGIITGYSDCFGAGLLMEELCFGVGTIKLDKMVEGYDNLRTVDEDLRNNDFTKMRDGHNLTSIIKENYANSDLTTLFPADRLRRLNEGEEPQLCDMRMTRTPDGSITASYFDGTQFVTGLANKSISRYPVEGNPLPDVLGTFRPVNFDG